MLIAHHLIFTLYGWWLPNDPRGSYSRVVRNDVLRELGELHYGRKKVQPPSAAIRQFYNDARDRLSFELREFRQEELGVAASGFAQAVAARNYTCYACAIMPDHVHLLIRKHRDSAEEMIEKLQQHGRGHVLAAGMRPPDHPVWTRSGWRVFLGHPEEVRRTIRYIEANPLKIAWERQAWGFVKPYDNWPLHPGHNPNSPYARRLRSLGRCPQDGCPAG